MIGKSIAICLLFCLVFMARPAQAQLDLGLTFTPEGTVQLGQALKFDAQVSNLVGLNVGDLANLQLVPTNLVNVSQLNIDNLTLTNLGSLPSLLGSTINIGDAISVLPSSATGVSGQICLQATLLGTPTSLGCGNFQASPTPPPPTFLITLAGSALMVCRSGLRRIKRSGQAASAA